MGPCIPPCSGWKRRACLRRSGASATTIAARDSTGSLPPAESRSTGSESSGIGWRPRSTGFSRPSIRRVEEGSMFQRKRRDGDFRDEVEAHLGAEAERLKTEGLPDREAEAAARRRFGNVTAAQERFYESQRWMWFDSLRRDLRFGARLLRRQPGFSVAAV